MSARTKLLIAALVGIALVAGTSAYAMQSDAAGQLRASGLVGEQSDGYLGLVGSAPAAVRAQMEQVNIQRRAAYTQLATTRGARAPAQIPPPAGRLRAPANGRRAGPPPQPLRLARTPRGIAA